MKIYSFKHEIAREAIESISMRSPFAKYRQTYQIKCNCGEILEVDEYKEPAINDAGSIKAQCLCCQKEYNFHLLLNVDGAALSKNLKLIDYEYD